MKSKHNPQHDIPEPVEYPCLMSYDTSYDASDFTVLMFKEKVGTVVWVRDEQASGWKLGEHYDGWAMYDFVKTVGDVTLEND